MRTVSDATRGASGLLQAAWLKRGPLAVCLLPVAWLFGVLSLLRQTLYRMGWLQVHALPVPVVVVGNLVAGGAGKTPTVIAVVQLLRSRGFRPGVVSRGYGRADSTLVSVQPDTPATVCGDEPLLLRRRTGAPVTVGRDRVAAAQALLQDHPHVNIIVSDDGLQHWQLGRQAQVLVFDDRGAGNGWLLPAGPLRERLPSRVPARTLVLYNASAASTPLPGSVAQRRLAGVVSLQDWWSGREPSRSALESLRSRPVVAAAGLARPQRFFEMLRSAGLNIEPVPLPDHCAFEPLPWPPESADVVVTEKDAVKLLPDRMGRTQVWVAALDFTVGSDFDEALLALLPPPPAPTPENAHGSPTA